MSGPCPAPAEWTRKLDGEVTANRASAMDDHVVSCAACRDTVRELEQLVGDIAHPVAHDAGAAVDRVMAAIDSGAEVAPIRRPARWLYPVAGALAAAAVLIVFATVRSGGAGSGADEGTFQARGGGDVSDPLRRTVGITVRVDGADLADGARVSPDARYTAGYRNLFEDGPVYAMVFAIDAAGDVHWLYPAYVDPATDPAGIRLDRATVETAFDDGAILDRPAPGAMRVVTLFATAAAHVSEIEQLAPEARGLDALRERFSGARIEQLEVTVSR